MIESQLPVHYIPSNNSLLNFASKIPSLTYSLHEDSFFLLNLSDIINKIQAWKNLLPNIIAYHDISKYYDESFLQFLSSLNVGYECHTKNDIIASQLNTTCQSSPPIFYNGECKLASHIKLAKENSVGLITFGSKLELERIIGNHPHSRLMFNLTVDKTNMGDMSLFMKAILEIFVSSFNYKNQIIGISITTIEDEDGSLTSFTNSTMEFYNKLFNVCSEIIKMATNLGYTFTTIHLNSPYFGVYKSDEDFEKFACHMNGLVGNITLQYPSMTNFYASATPYLFSSKYSSALCTPIISVINPEEETQQNRLLFVNNGVYDAFLYYSLVEALNTSDESRCKSKSLRVRKMSQSSDFTDHDNDTHVEMNRKAIVYDIYGSTGSEDDKIGMGYKLPPSLTAGDWLIFYFADDDLSLTNFKYDPSIKTIFLAFEDQREMFEDERSAPKKFRPDPGMESMSYDMVDGGLCYDDKSEELEIYLKYLFGIHASEEEDLYCCKTNGLVLTSKY